MSGTIAQLGIEVNSSDAVQAATDLDKLAQAGAKAEKASVGLSTQADKAESSLKELGAQAKSAEQATAKLTKQTEAAGISAAQTAAALRGVPAQFTDIVTSLQGGQSPLTVLMQQGGQLKDMFGGIGPAASALGGYVASLVSPFTVAAAAVGVLGVAYYKGSEESSAYQKALILTGNAAGTSSDQLASLASQVGATVGTTGAAAEVLAQLASSGKIAGESFGEVATSALQMRDATGRAVEETIAEFIKIAKDPVAAAKELNEQYSFLTASVYSQIVALKEQGREQDAVKLLTDTYADTVQSRSKQVVENLNLWERAWNGVSKAASEAVDGLKNAGREKSYDDQINELKAKLTGSAAFDVGGLRINPGAISAKDRTDVQGQISFIEMQRDADRDRIKFLDDQRRIQKDGIDAAGKLKAISDANLTNEEKRNKLIKEYQRDVETLRKANPNDPLVQADVVAKNIQNIKDKNKDPAGRASQVDLSGYNDAQNAIKSVQTGYANAEKELEAQQKAGLITQQNYLDQRTALIRAEREEVTSAYQAEIAALEEAKGRATTSAAQRIQLDQKIADARTNMVKAQKDADSQLNILSINEQGRVEKQTAASKAYVDQLERQRAALEASGTRAASGLGLGDRQQGLQNSLDGATDKFNEERAKLLDRRRTAPDKYSLDDYQKDLANLEAAEDRYRATVIGNYDKMTAAQSDWRSGATSAYANYLQSANDVAGQTKSLFTNAFTSMEDAVVNFTMTGKLSFADFTKSILADMARIATRQAASGLLSSFASSALGAWLGGSTPTSAGSTQAGYSPDVINNWAATQAKGGAWSGGVQMFANGGAFTNSVVSTPTVFGMSGGKKGVMGEAGPEAIVPLARDSQGRLGIRGGNSSSSQVTISFTIEASEGGGAMPDPVRLTEAIKTVARQEIANARRNGGALS